MDQHYTPLGIARSIVRALPNFRPDLTADFAVGEGSLLQAVSERWRSTELIATDINHSVIRGLRHRCPGIDAGVCNFLSGGSRAASPTLRRVLGRVSLAIINPPFSCRGGARWEVSLEDKALGCSTAMAFLINSIPYLAPDGKVVALLPTSCLTSEKDRQALDALAERFVIEKVGQAEPYEFESSSAHVSFVKLSRRGERGIKQRANNVFRDIDIVKSRITNAAIIMRGTLQMHEIVDSRNTNGIPLVHTTSLRNGRIEPFGRVRTTTSLVRGPAILIPRVGRLMPGKMCLHPTTQLIAISDCVMAIQAVDRKNFAKLQATVFKMQRQIALQYTGMCAQYITLARLARLLTAHGIECSIRRKRAIEPIAITPAADLTG